MAPKGAILFVMTSIVWPKIIGHRGSAGTAPENTLISFREAYEGNVQAIEFDVVLAKDGVPVVFHDETLDRITHASGYVWDFTLAELQKLDAGSKFLPQFAGEPIPSLEQVLKLSVQLNLYINIEIKPAPGQEIKTVEAVIDVTERFWPADRRPPLISSFKVASLEAALDFKPNWPRGLLLHQCPPNWQELVETVKATTIYTNANQDIRVLKMLIASGKPVFAYTVNEVKRVQSLFQLGMTGIFTDYPAQMMLSFRKNLKK